MRGEPEGDLAPSATSPVHCACTGRDLRAAVAEALGAQACRTARTYGQASFDRFEELSLASRHDCSMAETTPRQPKVADTALRARSA